MKIELSDKQAAVIMSALEAFQRMRAGQFRIAFEEVFPKKCWDKGWDEMKEVEDYLKKFFFGDELKKGSYWGIPNQEKIGEDAQISYEIYCVLRQFLSLKRNNGLFGMGTNFNSPLKLTDEPLPVIEGHKELTYKIHEFPDQVAAKKLFAAKDSNGLFDMVEKMNLPYGYCASREIVWIEGEHPEVQKIAVKINQPHEKLDSPKF